MFTDKYRPNKLDDFIGNKANIPPFVQWLTTWNEKSKCALISGVNGIGKSLLVELVLKQHNYHMVHTLSKETIQMKKTMSGQLNCLVVHDTDIEIAFLIECIRETRVPIVCICDDRYDQRLKTLLNYCFDVKLTKPANGEIQKLIHLVIQMEQIKMDRMMVEKLLEEANGDIRFILNRLQLNIQQCETNKNIQSANIFETTKQMLAQHHTLNEKYNTFWLSPELHTLMVQENYIQNILMTRDDAKRLDYISYASDSLSDSDLLDAIFDFELSPHIALNTIRATSKCHDKGMIVFPQYLGKTSTMNKNKRDKIQIDDIKFPKEKEKEIKPKKETKTKPKETKIKPKKETKPRAKKFKDP